jgi:hypothetical protein
VIFSLEMSREEVLGRITCACASVDSHKYFSGHLDREERGRFAEASAAIDGLPLLIDDSSIVTVPAMHAAVRRYNASNPKLRLVWWTNTANPYSCYPRKLTGHTAPVGAFRASISQRYWKPRDITWRPSAATNRQPA